MELPDRRTASVLLTILLFTLGIAVIYIARAVIIVFAFSILFAYLINPIVRFLQRHSLFFKNLRGPHVVEAYLAVVIVVVVVSHGLAPELHKNPGRSVDKLNALADRVSTGEIANDLGSSFGWSESQVARVKTLLQRHRSSIEHTVGDVERFASTAITAILVIPILALFFLNDGENISNQVIHLVSTKDNSADVRSLAGELHVMLQCYIRAKVILGALSLIYCSTAMLALRFPNAIALGVMAGILEFIPMAGWMIAGAIIVSAGALAHAHWISMLALLCVWRILMDYLISPRVMGRELEVHPLLTIFAMMVGGALGGIVGIYLSMPLIATLRVVYSKFAAHETGPDGSDCPGASAASSLALVRTRD
jgi:predicted PurR-regulated permease PerM